jgi:hypothetical protein
VHQTSLAPQPDGREASKLPNARIAPPLSPQFSLKSEVSRQSRLARSAHVKFRLTVPSPLHPALLSPVRLSGLSGNRRTRPTSLERRRRPRLRHSNADTLRQPPDRHADTFSRHLAILALRLVFPVALMARDPSIIVRSPPLEPASATLERLEKLGAFRSGPILFRVGSKVVQGRIVKVSIEQSSRYPFLDREGVDWATKHWSFGVAATGTYHVSLVVGAKTRPGPGRPLPPVARPAHLVPRLSKATWGRSVAKPA